jgi:hypothetical protein
MRIAPSIAAGLASVMTLTLAAGTSARPQGAESAPAKPALFQRADTPLPPDAYCTVNGFPVLKSEIGAWLLTYKGETHIQDYVIAKLVRDAAKTAGVEVKPEEIDQRVDQQIEPRILSSFRGRRELFEERELTYYARTLEQYKRQLAWDIETELLVHKTIRARRLTTDADVEKEFKRLYGSSGRSLNLRAVLIELDVPSVTSHRPVEEIQRMTNAAIENARRKGVDIVKRLQSGALDFASAARAYSDDARSKLAGGDIGAYIPSPPEFGEEFDGIVQRAKVGQVLGPVRIQQGYLVAEITKEVIHDLRKERDEIRKQLASREATYDEVQQFVQALVMGAKLVR